MTPIERLAAGVLILMAVAVVYVCVLVTIEVLD